MDKMANKNNKDKKVEEKFEALKEEPKVVLDLDQLATNINNDKIVKELLIEHNKCRQDPLGYIQVLERYLTYFLPNDDFVYKLPDGGLNIKSVEGKKAILECIEYLKTQEPLEPLQLAEGLCKSSEDHVYDLGPKGVTGHTGTDNSAPADRIKRYVDWGVSCSENITFGPASAEDILVGLIVDDNVPNRGHRLNVFNKNMKFMGAKIGPHLTLRYMCTVNYAAEIISDSQKGIYFQIEEYQQKTINNTTNKCLSTTKRKKLTDTEKRVKKEDFYGKMKTIRQTGKMLFDESEYKKLDEHVPADAVSATIKKITFKENGKITKKIIKTYIRLDGSKHIVEYEDKS